MKKAKVKLMTKTHNKLKTKKINTSIALSAMFVAISALMIPPTAMAAIGDLVTTFPAIEPGNGRGIAFDGGQTLYYTNTADEDVYKISTTGVDLGMIPNPGRDVACGALDYNGTSLLCAQYELGGPANYTSIDLATGAETILFNSTAFGLSLDPADNCFDQPPNLIDGVALDSDGTIWTSDDGGEILYHVNSDGTLINSYVVPSRAGIPAPGCNSGIAVAGDYLELSLINREPGFEFNGDSEIVKVPKSDPTTVIVRFNPGTDFLEDITIDPDTYAPKTVLWGHEACFGTCDISAWEVQSTRTIGYWKNHSEDTTPFLPIALGDGSEIKDCQVVNTDTEARNVLKAHGGQDAMPKLKAQLLAAKLNVALGSIPSDDLVDFNGNITAADNLIASNGCDPDTGKKGSDRQAAQELHDFLDFLNNKYSI